MLRPARVALTRFGLIGMVCMAAWIGRAAAEAPPHFPADRPLDMRHIRLELTVDLERKTVDGRATLDLAALRDVQSITLDAVDFDVSGFQIGVRGETPQDAPYRNTGKRLIADVPDGLRRGEAMRAVIDYRLVDPAAGLYFFGPTDEAPDAPYFLWTQGESITNRYWIPCFDHPNEMQTTEMICRVPKPYTAVSNGRLVAQENHDDGTRTFHWLQDQPHVVYLVSLVVGELTCRNETWRGKPVSYYVRPQFADWIDHSFANTRAMLDFFSDRIGVEYPWDKYAQVCCYEFGGGMENVSATTLTERTLHDDRAHLDGDSDGLVAHELAHQWWGDLVTCKDWAHVWLNEGFATYFEALWAEAHLGADEFAVNMLRKAERAMAENNDKPIVHRSYESPDQQFDNRAYPKGAWVLHMLRRRLGEDVFWQGIQTYARRFSHRNAETSDLRQVMEETSGRALGRFFYDWTERPGHPSITVAYEWLTEDGAASIRATQTQKEEAFHLPLEVELRWNDGRPPRRVLLEMTSKSQSVQIPLEAQPDLVRVDPDNGVLMDLKEEKPRDLWATQLDDDPGVVGRIRAARHFGETARPQDIVLLGERLFEEPFWAVQAEIAAAIGKSDSPEARDGLLKALTLEHPKARIAVVRALESFEGDDQVAAALLELAEKGDPSYRVEAAAMKSYAAVAKDDVLPNLNKWLNRDSCNEIIRRAVLEALGAKGDPAAIESLIAWCRPGRPAPCRAAACGAIGDLLEAEPDIDRASVEEAVDAVASCLESRNRRLQGSALGALRKIGRSARKLLPTLERLAATGQPRIRTAARETARRIRLGEGSSEGLKAIREELSSLREKVAELSEQIEQKN